MPKYKVAYKTSSIFEMDENRDFDFEESKIHLIISEKVIEMVLVELEASDEQNAENKANGIIMQLNDFWSYLYRSFLIPEPLKVKYIEKSDSLRTVGMLSEYRVPIRGKVNIDDVVFLYRCVKNKKSSKWLKLSGDANRPFKWEFLQLFKIIEFEKKANERENFISKETGLKKYRRKSGKDNFSRTRLTWKRIDMAHNQCPIITQDDLEKINELARKRIDEQLNQKTKR